MALYVGIDCGTQGTKVIVFDSETSVIKGEGYAPHRLITDDSGAREQDPGWWIEALDSAMSEALTPLGGARRSVRAIGVSGQQHGLVILDSEHRVIRNAKLWNDTESAHDNTSLISSAGGEQAVLLKIGTAIPVGYTASKLVWLKRCEPEAFRRIRYTMNPKDYINYYLSEVVCTDSGSASGTGYFDVIHRKWNDEMVNLVDDSGILQNALPRVVDDLAHVGRIRAEIGARFGLDSACVVVAGSGDNMMAAVGTGNVESGIATVTLGTSGVLSVFTDQAPEGYPSIVQIQNSLPNGWLPTVCTMNATSTTGAVQQLLAMDLTEFDQEMESAAIGSEGIIMFPFFNGERMPPLPHANGLISGLTTSNMSRRNLIRASAEAVVLGLRWGYDLLREKGIELREVRLVGGGSNSRPWRQIVADVLNVEVLVPQSKEAGALGAAIQAMAACGEGEVPALCKRHVRLDERKRGRPVPENVTRYEELYQSYLMQRRVFFGL